MKLVRKGLNFILASFALTLLSIVIMLITGFINIEPSNEQTITAIMLIVAPIIAIVGSVFEFVGFGYAKFGGNKRFGVAFWVAIAVIAADIISMIISLIKIQNPDVVKALNIIFGIIAAGSGIVVTLFATGGCSEAVPEMKNRAHVVTGFMIAGYALNLILKFIPNGGSEGNDAYGALSAIAGIALLVGLILYIILVCKTRNRLPKEK